MRPVRVHLTGASGPGTTTLARALASAWHVPHVDELVATVLDWNPTA